MGHYKIGQFQVVGCLLAVMAFTFGAANSSAASPVGPAAASVSEIREVGLLTFNEWKELRVDEARLVLERVMIESQMAETSKQTGATERNARGRVEQARLSLDITKELTFSDYQQIYLSQNRKSEQLRDLAKRMSSDEVAALLIYSQQTPRQRENFSQR